MGGRWAGRDARRIRAWVGVAGVVAAAVALGAWATAGRATALQFTDPGVAAGAAAPALAAPGTAPATAPATSSAPAPEPTEAARFGEQCEAVLRRRDAPAAVAGCSPFVKDPRFAADAHAALAVAYMLKDPADATQSATHAMAAADGGSVIGSTLAAMHALRGDAGITMPMERIWASLQSRAELPQIQALHAQVGAAMRCREKAKFRLSDRPVFCLLRGEIQAWATEGGMERQRSNEPWSDRYRVTRLLPGISAMTVAYDRDATTELFSPAALSFQLDASSETDPVVQDITAALDAKYQRAGRGVLRWSAPEGVLISLRTDAARLALHYELPERVESARRHAQLLAQQRTLARIEKAKSVL